MYVKIRSWLSLAAKFAVALLLMTYLVKSGNLDLASLASLMTPFNVFLGLFLVGINTVLLAWRWLFLLRARGFNPKVSYVGSLYLIGMFFNFALPGSVGGDFVKGFYIARDHKERRTDAVFSIFIDRVLGLYTFFLLTLVAVAFDFKFVMGHEQIRWVAISCFSVFMGMTLFFIAAFSNRLQRWLRVHHLEKISPRLRLVVRTLEVFREFGTNRKVIMASVAVSLLSQIAMLLFFYFVGIALGETDVSWRVYLFAVPMGYLATALPIAPAGIGVGQVAFHYLFEAYLGRPTNLGTISITAAQLAGFAYAMTGAIFYIRYRRPKDSEEMFAK
jgi:uncharacterized protein (TIRG00374 family)